MNHERGQVLLRVENFIQETLQDLDSRQSQLQTLMSSENSLADHRDQELDRLQGRIRALDERLHGVRTSLSEADLQLAGGEEILREYLDKVSGMRHRLAEWAAGAIG